MKNIELEKVYNPNDFEERIYSMWKDKGEFKPKDGEGHFSVVMPPPNVTGILHIGHALNNSIQDVIVRYKRMTGVPVLWVPGTDHAGIATQNVVEKQLQKEGTSRKEIGREKFLERTWSVKEKHHDIIKKQLEKMGCSCDWDHERFTMDDGLSKAVREAFVTLYNRGLIYKGKYLVNYCPHCGTALSDDEVEYESVKGKLYEIKYPYTDGSGFITVATTRPETLFGDAAVAVNPKDERYTNVVGKSLHLPLTRREIPIISDSFVDISFGTGMVKITPAHDPNDFQCGKRHNLEEINILNPDGTLNDNCPEKYRNLKCEEARELVVEDLKKGGYFVSETEHVHDVGHCYRCGTTIEPYLSEQWFVKMSGMAKKALKALDDGEINFYPKRWENTYRHWMENIKDWCISRQLWWGHRIPVWYCKDCGEMIVSSEDVKKCPKCGSENLRQEEDVLDTWFSSWLWPFSTLGWPGESEDLKRFFPTTTLVSAYDIIFFWISRMIMGSEELLGVAPFHDIVITSLVRDNKGRKMSKSLGNGIDPIEVIDKYGADSLKFTLTYLAPQGQDVKIDMSSFSIGSRFCNKIWNASRYLLMNLEGRNLVSVRREDMSVFDKWILSSLNRTALNVKNAFSEYRLNDAAGFVYNFFWNDFCDWYIESCKETLQKGSDSEKDRVVSMLLNVLEETLRLLHPFVSFITEEIYQKLPNRNGDIIVSKYPEYSKEREDVASEEYVDSLIDIVRSVRGGRTSVGITVEKKIKLYIKNVKGEKEKEEFLKSQKNNILSFVGASDVIFTTSSPEKTLPLHSSGFDLFIEVGNSINVSDEIKKLEKEIEDANKLLFSCEKKLSNDAFIKNAKEEAIEKEKSKKTEAEERIQKAKEHIKLLEELK